MVYRRFFLKVKLVENGRRLLLSLTASVDSVGKGGTFTSESVIPV